MERIIVTEEQAKIIKIINLGCSSKAFRVVNISKQVDLDLVTIAHIVEGYPYEIKREYKVGDIVLRNGMLYEVLEVNVHLVDERCTLVCKAENREDLAHE